MNTHRPAAEGGTRVGSDALQQAVRRAVAADDTRALQERVLAQWQQNRSADSLSGSHRHGLTASLKLRRATAWAGALGLVLCIALAYGWRQHRLAEAALDELGEIDVLSQISAGEM